MTQKEISYEALEKDINRQEEEISKQYDQIINAEVLEKSLIRDISELKREL